jgi:hypothetical protein
MLVWTCDRSTWDAVPPNEALRLWLKVQLQQKPCESLHCGCQLLDRSANIRLHAVQADSKHQNGHGQARRYMIVEQELSRL